MVMVIMVTIMARGLLTLWLSLKQKLLLIQVTDTMGMDMVMATMAMDTAMDIMATIMAKGPLKLSLKQMLLPNQGMDTMDMDMDMDTMDMVMVMVMDMDIMLSMDTSMGRGLLMLSQVMDI